MFETLSVESKPVPLFEEHGEVLAHWSNYNWDHTTLICFDRHLDLKSLGQSAMTRIRNAPTESALRALNREFPFQDAATANYGLDNFLYAAIQLGWLGRLIWVFPINASELLSSIPQKLSNIFLSALSLLGGHGVEVMNSYHLHDAGPSVKISGVELQMTTVSLLPLLRLDPDTPIDVDLDFFGTETGRILYNPVDAAKSLISVGLTNLISMTASISSGFMAPSLRWVAEAFATELGYRPIKASVRRNPASHILRSLATEKVVTPSSLARLSRMLPLLGGGGWSLLSVLAGRNHDFELAESAFRLARRNDDGAHWPAYMIGVRQLAAGRPKLALPWFQLAKGDLVDSIQLHSVSLEALCLARITRFQESLTAAQIAIALTPIRREPYLVGVFSAKQSGDITAANEITEKLALLDNFLLLARGEMVK